METFLIPSASSWKSRNYRFGELITPYFGYSLIRPIYKKGIKWICEIVDSGEQTEFMEDEFCFL
jgi:hypothetical protein